MFVNFAKDEYIVMCLNEEGLYFRFQNKIFFDFSLTVEAATLIFISGGGGGGGGVRLFHLLRKGNQALFIIW